MKKQKPINVTDEGLAFALRARYASAAYLKGLTGGRIFPLYGSDGDIVGHINSSQDGAICHKRAIVPCLTSGHGNCPKVILYEDMDDTDERERT